MTDSPSAPAVDLESVKAAYALYSGELTDIRTSRRDLGRQRDDLKPKLDALGAELQRLREKSGVRTHKVVLALRAPAAAQGVFSVHYVIAGARWEPLYIARADTVTKRVTLVAQAQVTQNTGEDWLDAALTLSTSRPNRGGSMPKLAPNFLEFLQPATRYSGGGNAGAMMEMAAPPAPAAPMIEPDFAENKPMDTEAQVESAQVAQSGASTVYKIATPVNVPSDGEAHQVNVLQLDLEPRFMYETTPRLQADVFLKAKLKNQSGGPLLPGAITIFRDGDMVGRAALDFVAADEEYDLFLGIDDSMKAEFEELTDKQSQEGLINKTTVAERKYQLKLKNFSKEVRKVTVLDQLPVSRQEKIKVSDAAFEPKPKSVDAENGKITWEVDIPAGGEFRLINAYKVIWPRDSNVSGL